MAYIYHLIRPSDWEKTLQKDAYKPASLKDEGFIHFSNKEQVLESAKLHFPDVDQLVLLAVHEKRVKNQLKWEASRKGELFPHLYSKLRLEWIDTTFLLSRNAEGKWEWEE